MSDPVSRRSVGRVLLIVTGSLAAMSVATLIMTAMCRAGVRFDEMWEHALYDPRSHRGSGEGGRAFAAREEIALRTDRRPRPRSTTALRRRHLAAVLPADARR
jgi:hypothetical protein